MSRNEEMPMMQSLESRQMLSVTLADGVLSVEGTDGDDVIAFSVDHTVPEAPALVVTVNGESTSNDLALVTSIRVDAGDGHDSVALGDVAIAATLLGGNGKDSLSGGSGDDVIEGGNGKDVLAGLLGNDTLLGGNGKDNLAGGDGDDALDGGRGKDVLDGGAGTNVLEDEEKQSKRKGPKKDKDRSPIDDDGTDDHKKQKGKGHAKKKGKGHR